MPSDGVTPLRRSARPPPPRTGGDAKLMGVYRPATGGSADRRLRRRRTAARSPRSAAAPPLPVAQPPPPPPLSGGSATLTVIVQDAEFPDPSVAVKATSVVPTGKKLPLARVEVIAGAGSPASVAVAIGNVTAAPPPPLALTFAGQVIAGGVVSTTTTEIAQLAPLPWPSVAVAMTAVVPIGNGSEGAWL